MLQQHGEVISLQLPELKLRTVTISTQYNAHFFNQNFNIKTGGAHYTWVYLYMCGYVENTTFVV